MKMPSEIVFQCSEIINLAFDSNCEVLNEGMNLILGAIQSILDVGLFNRNNLRVVVI
jgi:hypothetical protein